MRSFGDTIKSTMQHTILCVSLLLVFFVSNATSMAAWSPIIRHFTPQDYGAGTQNWDIVEHTNGWIYVANNYGLLETDGTQWQLYGIHNATAIRSLALGEDGAIYVGGTDEFGVFRSDSLGGLAYQNLSYSIRSAISTLVRCGKYSYIISIFTFKQGIIFSYMTLLVIAKFLTLVPLFMNRSYGRETSISPHPVIFMYKAVDDCMHYMVRRPCTILLCVACCHMRTRA